MGTEKRDRKKANRAARLAAEQAADARRRRLKFIRNAVIVGVAIVVVAVLLSGCSDGDDDGATGGTTTAAEGDGDATLTPCPPADGAAEPRIDFDAPFEDCLDPDVQYSAVIETTQGTITVALDTERTPDTVNNFAALARSGYYDGTDLFRVVPGSGIIQGGSPHTQDNTDPGPGYTIADEGIPFTSEDYEPGALAMARTPAPDSASAQFFFVASENGRYLGDPSQAGGGTYVVFGQTIGGLDVLEAIAALGTDDPAANGVPSEQITVTSITIVEN